MKFKTSRVQGFKALDDGKGQFEAVVAVFGNVDLGGDRIVKGAFADSLKTWTAKGRPIPVVFSHDWANLDAHIGEVLEAKETDQGLWVRAQLDMDDPPAAKVFRMMKRGTLAEFSFAYDIVEEKLQNGANELLKLDVIEVGPCLKGMNPATQLIGVKALAGQTPEFGIGDRVRVDGQPHMDGQGDGTVAVIEDTYAYGVLFDGMEEMGIHRWYVQDELMAAEGGDEQPAPMDGMGSMQASSRRRRHRKSSAEHAARLPVSRKQAVAGSFEERRELVSSALWAHYGDQDRYWVWVMATFDDSAIYRVEDSEEGAVSYREIDYTLKDGTVELGDERDVVLQTTIVPKSRTPGAVPRAKSEEPPRAKGEEPRPSTLAARVAAELLEIGVD